MDQEIGSGADRPTSVELALEGGELVVKVADGGPGFDPDQVPDPLAPENLLKPTGRGILLMRNFMDEVAFEFLESGGTLVRLRKALQTAPAPRPKRSA